MSIHTTNNEFFFIAFGFVLALTTIFKENHCGTSPKKPSPIDRLKRIFSFREEKSSSKSSKTEAKKQMKAERAAQWQEDEKSVRAGTCTFHVKVKYPERSLFAED